jgi:outer membrane receptor protein involved in Fe transport
MITIFRPRAAVRAALLAGGACLSFTSVATAQSGGRDAAADSIMLEEVLVTARKREESLQDVPMSITAFSADAIEQRGIESVYDVARLTPNLSFNQAYGRTFDRPVIRGMSQILGERTVSFVIDGIYIAGNVSGTDIDDIESIEVLKGPQAANFGRGSLAGVISYRTRKPSADWRGEASASLGEDGYQEFTGNISGPIVGETLTFKLGARYYDYDGQYRAVSSDGSTPTIGGERTERVSGALRWQPTESFDFTLRAFAAQNNDDLYNNIISTTLNCFQTQGGAAARGGSYCGRIPVIPQEGGIFIDKSDIARQGDPGVTSDTFLYSGEANWDIGPVTATALISWNRQDEDWIVDDYIINRVVVGASGPSQAASPTMTIQNPGNITRLIQIREYRSQELRFASNDEGRWQWLAGVYHYDQQNSGFNGGPRYNVNLANGMAAPTNTGPTGTLREVSQPSSPFEVENTAVFAAVNFDPTDRWHLSLEGRYAKDELATNNTVQSGGNCAPRLEAEFSSFTPRASVRFDLSEDANVYFSVAQGNKPGDFNNSLCSATVPADEFARLSTIAPLGIDEEQSLNYEVGTKWRLLGGRMSLEAAVFYTDWEDQQVTGSQVYRQTNGTISNISLSTNAGSTEVYGLELSWRFRPNENWDFDLGYGYVNAEFKELCDNVYATLLGTTLSPITSTGPCPSAGTTRFESVAGFQTANSPEHSLSAGAQLSVPINERWSFFARTDASFQSERFAEVYNHASTGDSLRFDARLGVEGDSWKVTAWGRNIGNERSADSVVRFFNPDSPAFTRAYQVHYPNGRQLGVTAEYRF